MPTKRLTAKTAKDLIKREGSIQHITYPGAPVQHRDQYELHTGSLRIEVKHSYDYAGVISLTISGGRSDTIKYLYDAATLTQNYTLEESDYRQQERERFSQYIQSMGRDRAIQALESVCKEYGL